MSVLPGGCQESVEHQTGDSDGTHPARDGSEQPGHLPHTGTAVTSHLPARHSVQPHVNDHAARLDDVLVQEAGNSCSRDDEVWYCNYIMTVKVLICLYQRMRARLSVQQAECSGDRESLSGRTRPVKQSVGWPSLLYGSPCSGLLRE